MRFKLWWAFEVKVYYDWSSGYAADGWMKWFLLKNQEDIIPEVYPLVITNRFPIILIAWKCYVHLTLYFIHLMKFSVGWWLDSLSLLSGSNWLWLFTILFSNSLGTKNKGIKKSWWNFEQNRKQPDESLTKMEEGLKPGIWNLGLPLNLMESRITPSMAS